MLSMEVRGVDCGARPINLAPLLVCLIVELPARSLPPKLGRLYLLPPPLRNLKSDFLCKKSGEMRWQCVQHQC